jgi:hypothetical protein
MSLLWEPEIRCDDCGISERGVHVDDVTFAGAKLMFERMGWQMRNKPRRDLCPDCKRKRP